MSQLPAGWSSVRLGDLGTWYGGGTPSKSRPEFWEGGSIPWLSPKDMGADVIGSTQDLITEAAVAESATRLVPAGSVAVVVRSGILERKLPVALVPMEVSLNQDMKALVPRADVDPRWVAWGLRATGQDILGRCRKAGTTVASIDTKLLLAQLLPLPPLEEQQCLVDLLEDHLSRLDAASAMVTGAAKRTWTVERAALDAFTSSGEGLVPMAALVERVEAGRSFGAASRPASESEWGIIKVSAMTWGAFRPEENKVVNDISRVDERFEIRTGDLLVSRANTSAYVGAAVLVEQPRQKLLLSDKSLRLVPKAGVDPAYLHAVLRAPRTRSQITAMATGTKDSMRNISQGSLLSVLVPITSEEGQQQVVDAVRGFTVALLRLRADLDRTRTRGRALRRALLTAAFNGDLTRVPSRNHLSHV